MLRANLPKHSAICALVVSGVIFVVQLTAEGRRRRREERAAKARRLRLIESGEEVQVEALPEGHYHTFLSHVWGTGQDQVRSRMRTHSRPAVALFKSFLSALNRCAL